VVRVHARSGLMVVFCVYGQRAWLMHHLTPKESSGQLGIMDINDYEPCEVSYTHDEAQHYCWAVAVRSLLRPLFAAGQLFG
jgi:hypothetical protein